MTVHNDVQTELAIQLAEIVLEQLAPEELVIFDETAAEYFADPDAALNPRRRDERVGFGLDLAMLTPYAIAVAGAVVPWLLATVGDAVRTESEGVLKAWVQALFRRGRRAASAPEPQLSVEQARTLHGLTRAKAAAIGLAEQQAGELADAVVGAFVVAPTGP